MRNADILLNPHVEVRHSDPSELIRDMEGGKSVENMLIILDDGLNYVNGKSGIVSLFNRLANHGGCSVFFVSQACFGGPLLRAIVQNTNFFCLFPSRNDPTSLSILSARLFPSKPNFLPHALKQVSEQDPYSPLLVNTRPDFLWERMRVFSGFLQGKQSTSQFFYFCIRDSFLDEQLLFWCPT